jgi:hypothetical protein
MSLCLFCGEPCTMPSEELDPQERQSAITCIQRAGFGVVGLPDTHSSMHITCIGDVNQAIAQKLQLSSAYGKMNPTKQ